MTTFKKILTFLDFDNGKRFPKQDNLGNFKKMVVQFQNSLKPGMKLQETRVHNRESSFDLKAEDINQYLNCSLLRKLNRTSCKTSVTKITITDAINCRQHLLLRIILLNRGRGIELRTLKLEEVANAEHRDNNYIIKPLDHKTGKSGKEAFIVLKQDLFNLLQAYIQRIRPIFKPDKKLQESFFKY